MTTRRGQGASLITLNERWEAVDGFESSEKQRPTHRIIGRIQGDKIRSGKSLTASTAPYANHHCPSIEILYKSFFLYSFVKWWATESAQKECRFFWRLVKQQIIRCENNNSGLFLCFGLSKYFTTHDIFLLDFWTAFRQISGNWKLSFTVLKGGEGQETTIWFQK